MRKKKKDIENQISNLSILSRNETLKEIMTGIINNNEVLKEIEKSKGKHEHSGAKEQPSILQNLVNGYISKIQGNPTKKIIYLREFLENFPSISNNDKDVIINSLKDEKNDDKLKEKMTSLVTIFM